jgi:hypothetical protein
MGVPVFCRFLEDQTHDKQVLIEKLTLKNTTFKAAIAKLEAQLAHKEEMGEVRNHPMPEAGLAGLVWGPACLKQHDDSLPTQNHHIRSSQAGSSPA